MVLSLWFAGAAALRPVASVAAPNPMKIGFECFKGGASALLARCIERKSRTWARIFAERGIKGG